MELRFIIISREIFLSQKWTVESGVKGFFCLIIKSHCK